jgi:hypothetical protein
MKSARWARRRAWATAHPGARLDAAGAQPAVRPMGRVVGATRLDPGDQASSPRNATGRRSLEPEGNSWPLGSSRVDGAIERSLARMRDAADGRRSK